MARLNSRLLSCKGKTEEGQLPPNPASLADCTSLKELSFVHDFVAAMTSHCNNLVKAHSSTQLVADEQRTAREIDAIR